MKFQELIVLLPCHSLEDFPVYHEGDDADGVLAAWSALWHPALLVAAGKAPVWRRVDTPPAELDGRLIVVPSISFERLPIGFAARARDEGAVLVSKLRTRDEIVAAALAGNDAPLELDAELTADFLALGYARLQVELLTRQMRYASNLDELAFERQAVAAATALAAGQLDDTRRELAGCFNLLNEARKYFYPVDSYLVDLTLTAATTLGPALAAELGQSLPSNLLISGELVAEIAANRPTTLAALRAAVERGNWSIVGGEFQEDELPLLPLDAVLAGFQRGQAEYYRVLGKPVKVFGRRRYGLSATLPQLLARLGYAGAMHVTLDDGRFPLGMQSKLRWEGDETSAIDTLARLPRDAALAETFLGYARRLGEAMDSDHVATVVMAHWPGLASPWYSDLRRIARYTPALGRFVTLEEYFSDTYAPSQTAHFAEDEYRAPYLKQAIIRRQPNPISLLVAAHRAEAQRSAIQTLATLAELAGKPAADAAPVTLAAAIERFAGTLPIGSGSGGDVSLVLNPCSFSTRVLLRRNAAARANGAQANAASLSAESISPESAASSAVSDDAVLVEVPPLGFATHDWRAPDETGRKREKPLAEGNVLRNEFFEVTLHPTGGGIQLIHDYRHRANRLSQQLAFRTPPAAVPVPGEVWRDPDETAEYSSMQADSIEVTHAGRALGEIVSRGSLVAADGRKLAGFEQRTQVWRGSRVIRIAVQLDPNEEPRSDPWNSYFAARFAWSDPSAALSRSVHGARHPTSAKRIEAPEFIEIDSAEGRATILTGGLPYHRRSSERVIDSLLVVRGESARSFELGIGIDLPCSAAASAELLAPLAVKQLAAPLAGSGSGWLFHLDLRSVVATHWEPLRAAPGAANRPAGFRVRLRETSGEPVRLTLRAFRELAEACKTDWQGNRLSSVPVSGDRLECDLAGYEWAQLEVRW